MSEITLGERYEGSDGQWRSVFRAGRDDTSPIHRHWEPGKYDARCSSCWLGYAHSEAQHRAAIGE